MLREHQKNIFAVEVEDRSAETIERIISFYVCPGSTVHTDGWKAYIPACLNLEWQRNFVNHGINLKNPITDIHTNTIEGVKNVFTTLIVPQNRIKKIYMTSLVIYM